MMEVAKRHACWRNSSRSERVEMEERAEGGGNGLGAKSRGSLGEHGILDDRWPEAGETSRGGLLPKRRERTMALGRAAGERTRHLSCSGQCP